MGGALVSWSGEKQCTVSTSTTGAEYVALGHALGDKSGYIASSMRWNQARQWSWCWMATTNPASHWPKISRLKNWPSLSMYGFIVYESWLTKKNSLSPGYPARTWWPLINKGSHDRHLQKAPALAGTKSARTESYLNCVVVRKGSSRCVRSMVRS